MAQVASVAAKPAATGNQSRVKHLDVWDRSFYFWMSLLVAVVVVYGFSHTVVGRLMPAADSLAHGALPLGLAHGWKLLRPVAAARP